MNALQYMLVGVLPAVVAGYVVLVVTGRGRLALLVTVGWLVLVPAVSAEATTKISGGPATVANHRWCNWFKVREQRYGVLDQRLWEVRERVTWCTNRSRTKVNWISTTWGRWARSPGWRFQTAVRTGRRAADRSWYSRRVTATFDGYTPFGLFDEQDRPFVRITVYARPRGRVSWNTGCGC